MSIGSNLKKARINAGMVQRELAEAVGVTQPMIAQIERGTKALTLELGREIAEVLNIRIWELLEDTAYAREDAESGAEGR